MKRKILFVAVHPDDETLGCGGTILKHHAAGDEVHWLILTSIRHHPLGLFTDEQVARRDATIAAVAQAYGFDSVSDLDLPTTMLDSLPLGELIVKVGQVIDRIKPDTIYMMFQHDVHSDHRVAFQAVYSCLKSFRHPFIRRVLMFEALSETEFAVALPQSAFVPQVYEDITPFMQRKLEVMAMYDTEVMAEPLPRSLASIEALARVRGTRAGVPFAEAFMLLYELHPAE